jgi:hypothetical protein
MMTMFHFKPEVFYMVTFSRHNGLDRLGPAHRYYAYCIVDLALDMPVSGILYQKKILDDKDIYDLAGVPPKYQHHLLKILLLSDWLGRLGTLYYLKDKKRFAPNHTGKMAMSQIKELIATLTPEELEVLGLSNGGVEVSGKELNKLYSLLTEYQRTVIQTYLRQFMTPAQISQNMPLSAMGKGKHVRLLKELIDIYQLGKLTFDSREYPVDRAQFFDTIHYVVSRNLKGLANHNYLKKVLMNGRYTSPPKNVEGF